MTPVLCEGKCGTVVAREGDWCYPCWADHDISGVIAKVINQERRHLNRRRSDPARLNTGRRAGEAHSSIAHQIAEAGNLMRVQHEARMDTGDTISLLAHLIVVAEQEYHNRKQEKE